ncbi:hypothetical protein ACFWNN_42405 [Lentzea sp. NPDC058450]|uniref:hypothetical protein n=1 Tax=Lentzea sp. NPDC058450 TaxID=3346505 RepID=UPI0036555C80
MLDERTTGAEGALSSRLRVVTMRLASAGASRLAAEARTLLCDHRVETCVELITGRAAEGQIGLTAREIKDLRALTGDAVVTARLARLTPLADQTVAVPVLPPSRMPTTSKHVLVDRAAAEACARVPDAVSLRVAWRGGRSPVRVHLVEFARSATDHDILLAARDLDLALDEWQVPNRSMESYRPGDAMPRGYAELISLGDEVWRRR